MRRQSASSGLGAVTDKSAMIRIRVCLKMSCTPKNPMVLLITIPTKWLFHWGYTGYTLFSDIPISPHFRTAMSEGTPKIRSQTGRKKKQISAKHWPDLTSEKRPSPSGHSLTCLEIPWEIAILLGKSSMNRWSCQVDGGFGRAARWPRRWHFYFYQLLP